MMKLKLKSEVVNTTAHIVGGWLVSYALVPLSPLWVLIWVNFTLGTVREFLQELRGKKQPCFIIVIDVLGWVVGGLIYYWLREAYGISG